MFSFKFKFCLATLVAIAAGVGIASASSSSPALQPSLQDLYRLIHHPSSEEELSLLSSFVNFTRTYNKWYSTEREIVRRFSVFKEGIARAEKKNERAKRLGSTARYGVTKFTDLTLEEFAGSYLMKKMPPIPKEKLPPYHTLNATTETINRRNSNSRRQPASFDWNSVPNVVTPVYNQGQCGSCWAFSATENHESNYAIQHSQPVVSMSVQQILDCDDPSQYGCNGGWPYQAWEYIQGQGGQDSANCYPYKGYNEGSCQWNPSGNCDAGSLTSWSWIYQEQEDLMIQWVYHNAPLSICVDASQWSDYKGGVVTGVECGREIDHCVLVTGYNTNSNPSFWNVRNSWGTDWGNGGYIYLEYDQNTCGMAVYPASCHTA